MGRIFFGGGKHVPDKRNTSNNCESDWSTQRHMIASVGRVHHRPRRGGSIAYRGRSLISTIALLSMLAVLAIDYCDVASTYLFDLKYGD